MLQQIFLRRTVEFVPRLSSIFAPGRWPIDWRLGRRVDGLSLAGWPTVVRASVAVLRRILLRRFDRRRFALGSSLRFVFLAAALSERCNRLGHSERAIGSVWSRCAGNVRHGSSYLFSSSSSRWA